MNLIPSNAPTDQPFLELCRTLKEGKRRLKGVFYSDTFLYCSEPGVHDFSHCLLRQWLLLWDAHRGCTWSSGRWRNTVLSREPRHAAFALCLTCAGMSPDTVVPLVSMVELMLV